MDSTNKDKNNSQLVPLSIIVAGLLVAGAVYFGGNRAPAGSLAETKPANAVGVVAPITAKDHILGNRNAQIVIVEYSDFDCRWCKIFHPTMHQVVSTYGDKVAWVYRHLPLVRPDSGTKKAEASECATDQGGNDAFWKYADKIFEMTPSGGALELDQLPVIASSLGLDVNLFNTCLSSGKYTSKIQADVVAAGKAGARGTPYSVILVKGKSVGTINGAQPFDTVKAQIDALIKN